VSAPLKLFNWPERPAVLEAGGIALLLCELNLPRVDARQLARKRLRELCAQLLNSTELTETLQGPVCPTGYISLSYAGNNLLIGLSRDVKLGVDIVAADPPPETGALTRLYLPAFSGNFALAWAQMEACSKALGLPLTENSRERSRQLACCKIIPCEQTDGYQIAVAVI